MPGPPKHEGQDEKADEALPETKRKRPDPTRYGDWEKNGRCIDF